MAKYTKQITLGIDPYTGKRIRKRVYGTSPTDLERKIRIVRAEADSVFNPSSVKFGTYAQAWLQAYKSTREAATVEMYRNALSKFHQIDQKKVKDITSLDLQLIINDNADHPATCQKLSLTLKQIFKRAVHDGMIRRNPAEDLQLPKKEHSEGRALTEREKKAIKKADLTDEERMYVELLYYFGLRPQEALGLMIKDFDFKDNILEVTRAVGYDGNTPYIKSTKTYKARIVPIPDAVVTDIKSYVQKVRSENSLYLMHRSGNLLNKRTKANLWLRIRKKINSAMGGTASIDMTGHLHPYVFRHNFCCECYYRKLSILKTAELMGNSPQMVMNVYAHLDNSKEPLKKFKKLAM